MAYPEKWLYSKIVEGAPGVPVHPVMAPQDTDFPAIVYRRTGTRREKDLSLGSIGRPVASFQVSVVSKTYLEAKELADSVRMKVDNFTGTASSVTIHLSVLASESDGMERPLDGQAKPIYRVDQTYEVRFTESVQGGT